MGLLFVLWGRLALGEMYHVSTGFGVQLHAHHQLVTHGPYKYLRHPMYLGVGLAGVGGILLYRSWTLVFVTAFLPGLILRARREEQALAAEFGAAWEVYRRRVPAWFPRH
jgi:protein-S-isoprenylcysteine O-methyltransferase Ste14